MNNVLVLDDLRRVRGHCVSIVRMLLGDALMQDLLGIMIIACHLHTFAKDSS